MALYLLTYPVRGQDDERRPVELARNANRTGRGAEIWLLAKRPPLERPTSLEHRNLFPNPQGGLRRRRVAVRESGTLPALLGDVHDCDLARLLRHDAWPPVSRDLVRERLRSGGMESPVHDRAQQARAAGAASAGRSDGVGRSTGRLPWSERRWPTRPPNDLDRHATSQRLCPRVASVRTRKFNHVRANHPATPSENGPTTASEKCITRRAEPGNESNLPHSHSNGITIGR